MDTTRYVIFEGGGGGGHVCKNMDTTRYVIFEGGGGEVTYVRTWMLPGM